MAENATLARPYAKAVFSIAMEEGACEKWSNDLNELSTIVMAMRELLKSKAISFAEVSHFFLEIVCSKVSDKPLKNFLLVLSQNKRIAILPEIAMLYEAMRAEAENTIRIEFRSAIVLTEEQKKHYETMLSKRFSRKVKMSYRVESSLLGGFLARAGNDVMDGSLRGFLKDLKIAMGS